MCKICSKTPKYVSTYVYVPICPNIYKYVKTNFCRSIPGAQNDQLPSLGTVGGTNKNMFLYTYPPSVNKFNWPHMEGVSDSRGQL